EVPEQRVRDLLAARRGVLRKQRLGLHDDPGRAEPALRRAGDGEAVRPPLPRRLSEALVRDDGLALDARGLLRARDDGAAVDEDGARPARPFRGAPVLRRSDPQLLAQKLEQALPLAELDLQLAAVEGEPHYSSAPSTSERSAIRRTTPLNASCQYRAWRVSSTSTGSSSIRGRLWRMIAPVFARSRSSSRVTR